MTSTPIRSHVAVRGDWSVVQMTGAFGAELQGDRIDVTKDGDWILSLLEEYRFLAIRGQHITHAEQVQLARALGEPTPAHPVVPGHPDFPEILELDGAKGGKNARWHTDVTFVETPPAASVLVGDVVPVTGGDTLWADLVSAFEHLSPGLQNLLEGLEAVHVITPLAYWGEPFDTALSREDAVQLFENAKKVAPVLHPVVRVHPTTGRKSLFVNPGFTSHIVGMSRIESDNLLKLLYEHSTQPEFVVRHRWRAGDVLLWDNRATMHYATDDYGTAERKMRRVTIRGTKPFGVNGVESRIAADPLIAIR